MLPHLSRPQGHRTSKNVLDKRTSGPYNESDDLGGPVGVVRSDCPTGHGTLPRRGWSFPTQRVRLIAVRSTASSQS